MLIHQIANKHLNKAVYCKGGGDGGAADATKKATQLQREQWQTTMSNLAPFTPLAQEYVGQLQNLSTLGGQNAALNQYYNSDQYKMMADQARYQNLAAAEATGGLGSTATSNQMAAIAPTMGQNWLSGQMNNYQNLANMGFGALTGQMNSGQSYANNAGQLGQQGAAIAAANANRPSTTTRMLGGAASGAAMGAMYGSAAGGVGAVPGAVIGGVMGAMGGYF